MSSERVSKRRPCPSCSGGAGYMLLLARRRDVVIVSDSNKPGQRRAIRLANKLRRFCQSVRIIAPTQGELQLKQSLWTEANFQ